MPIGIWILIFAVVAFALIGLFLLDTILRGFSDGHCYLIPHSMWEVKYALARRKRMKEEQARAKAENRSYDHDRAIPWTEIH